MTKVMITGSRGFIGSRLTKLLPEVVEYDIKIDRFQSILNRHSLRRFMAEEAPEIVVHLAANPNISKSIEDPVFDITLNTIGTLNVLEASVESSVKLFVYASSSYVYGEPQYLPVDENHPANPRTPYGIDKFAGECYCREFQQRYGLPIVIGRFFTIYGPDQPRGYVIPDLVQKIKECVNKGSIFLRGSPEDVRAFLHVEDLAHGIKQMVERKPVGETINLGSNVGTKISDLAKMIADLLGKKVELTYPPEKWERISRLVPDITKAKKLLSWQPTVPLNEGLRRVVLGDE
jgi:UDP-glucose 4-epimerase